MDPENKLEVFVIYPDLIEGLIRCMEIEFHNPINLGNNSRFPLMTCRNFRTKYGANEVLIQAHDDPKLENQILKSKNNIKLGANNKYF